MSHIVMSLCCIYIVQVCNVATAIWSRTLWYQCEQPKLDHASYITNVILPKSDHAPNTSDVTLSTSEHTYLSTSYSLGDTYSYIINDDFSTVCRNVPDPATMDTSGGWRWGTRRMSCTECLCSPKEL